MSDHDIVARGMNKQLYPNMDEARKEHGVGEGESQRDRLSSLPIPDRFSRLPFSLALQAEVRRGFQRRAPASCAQIAFVVHCCPLRSIVSHWVPALRLVARRGSIDALTAGILIGR